MAEMQVGVCARGLPQWSARQSEWEGELLRGRRIALVCLR